MSKRRRKSSKTPPKIISRTYGDKPKKKPVAPIHRLPDPTPIRITVPPADIVKLTNRPVLPVVPLEPLKYGGTLMEAKPEAYHASFVFWRSRDGVSVTVQSGDQPTRKAVAEELTRQAVSLGYKVIPKFDVHNRSTWFLWRRLRGELRPEDAIIHHTFGGA